MTHAWARRRTRYAQIVALAALIGALWPATPAAAETIGQASPVSAGERCRSGSTFGQIAVADGPSYRVGAAGLLISFSTMAYDSGATGSTMHLVVLRPGGGPGGTVVAVSAESITLPTAPPATALSVPIAPLPVEAGDYLGFHVSGSFGLRCLQRTQAPGDEFVEGSDPPVAGQPVGLLYATPTGFRLSVAATRVPPPDITPPETTITSGPSGVTADTSPTYTFESSETPATFECRVDAAAFASCASPFTTTALASGPHTFQVRAIDAAANVDPAPAARTTRVCAGPLSALALTLYQLLLPISPGLAEQQLNALCG
jgi:hypothetical protein